MPAIDVLSRVGLVSGPGIGSGVDAGQGTRPSNASAVMKLTAPVLTVLDVRPRERSMFEMLESGGGRHGSESRGLEDIVTCQHDRTVPVCLPPGDV